jgi:DNA-binding beta-propeller fold protein YncE
MLLKMQEKSVIKIVFKPFYWTLLLTCLYRPALSAEAVKTLWSVSSFGRSDFFHQPSDLEVDPGQFLIYIVDAGSNRVLVFDFHGKFLKAIGNKGQGPGEFMRPTGMCLLMDSGLAVADFGNNRIQIFDKSGKFVRAITLTEAKVADLILADGQFYTVPSFGFSGCSLNLAQEGKIQPLVTVLDDQGKIVREIFVASYPERQPFVRAIKSRVCLALSPKGLLYLPHFAMNVVQVFELSGKKLGEFTRPLPFKPMTPRLEEIKSPEKGIVQMRSSLDIVSAGARFGPDGNLYILTCMESLAERTKKKIDVSERPPDPMRLDVIDPRSNKVIRTIACDPGIKAFGLMDKTRLVYVHEDSVGELVLKCVQY